MFSSMTGYQQPDLSTSKTVYAKRRQNHTELDFNQYQYPYNGTPPYSHLAITLFWVLKYCKTFFCEKILHQCMNSVF